MCSYSPRTPLLHMRTDITSVQRPAACHSLSSHLATRQPCRIPHHSQLDAKQHSLSSARWLSSTDIVSFRALKIRRPVVIYRCTNLAHDWNGKSQRPVGALPSDESSSPRTHVSTHVAGLWEGSTCSHLSLHQFGAGLERQGLGTHRRHVSR